jgi:hypothetical protein
MMLVEGHLTDWARPVEGLMPRLLSNDPGFLYANKGVGGKVLWEGGPKLGSMDNRDSY